MLGIYVLSTGGALATALVAAAMPAQALAAGRPSQSIEVEAQSQDFGEGYGAINTIRLEYKFKDEDTTVIISPEAGERQSAGDSRTAIGFGAILYQDLTKAVTSRTSAAIAEDEPIFPQHDLAQDFTFKLVPQTTGTLGIRWARYFGDRDVYFVNAGLRYYFRRGSIAYRLSYVEPDGHGSFLAHLVNLSVKDPNGRGTTQLWVSTGASSLDRAPLDEAFSGDDYGIFVRRVQPISDSIYLTAGAGATSYDRPDNRVTAWKFALGLVYETGR